MKMKTCTISAAAAILAACVAVGCVSGKAADGADESIYRSKLETTPTGVRLLRDGKILWNFEIDTPEGRPFFHPLNHPSGRALTDLRPKDHVWHLVHAAEASRVK